jgi:hypothetical protein
MTNRIFFLLFLTLFFLAPTTSFASDYCGQTVPHDIAKEGFSDGEGEFSEGAFSDPGAKTEEEAPAFSGQVIYIPPGAVIPVTLDRALGSNFSKPGSIAYGQVDGRVPGIPEGTVAELVVSMTEPSAKFFGKPGRIQIMSNRLILPGGRSVWMKGVVVDRAGKQEITAQKNGTRVKKALKKAAIGGGAGALGGAAIGAIAGSSIGGGALAGAAIGVVVGGIWAALSKGQDVVLPQGLPVSLQVAQGAQAMY